MTTVEDFLQHNGVKGMKWGVVKDEDRAPISPRSGKDLDMHPNADGSIDIPKGVTVQRVVNYGKTIGSSGGTDFGDKVTYAAFTKGDRLRYEENFGYTKNLFVKESSHILSLTTKVPLKAPTPGKTSELYFKTLKDNPELDKQARTHLKKTSIFSDKGFDRIVSNPQSKEAYSMFGTLYDAGSYNKNLASVNEGFHNTMKKSGFNTLLDPSDSTFGGIYDAPIAVIDGSKNLVVTGRAVATKVSRRQAAQALKDYDKVNKGKKLMKRLGYDAYS